MNCPFTRRDIHKSMAAAAFGALLPSPLKMAVGAAGSCEQRGIVRITRGPRDLESPPTTPAGITWRYALCYPFQVAPTVAGLSVNIKLCHAPGQDWESGLDIILFDDMNRIRADKAILLTRNHEEPNPNAGGKAAIMAKYPGVMGFVPFGTRRRDGSAHPHAGTGFGTSSVAARPADDSEGLANFPDRVGRGIFRGEKSYFYFELFQFAYDGKEFRVVSKSKVMPQQLLPGWNIAGAGLTNPIPDGDDLLVGMKGGKPGRPTGAGLMRWRRLENSWRPISFQLITPEDDSLEPSIVRDVDGSLLFFARGRRDTGPPIRVWRSRNNGRDWEQIIFMNGLVGSVPISLNQAADGTPYVAANIKTPMIQVPGGDGGISRLEPKGGRGERSMLCVWPLNEARNGLESPLIARDPLTEFGVPPRGTVWAVDHPSAFTIRLADGQWHNVMGYRLLEWMENTHFVAPSPQTGSYVEEVLSIGKPMPIWNF